MEKNSEQNKKNWHDKHYKTLLLIPLALIIFSFVYMGIFYSQHNDFMLKDISLTGGTSVTINEDLNVEDLRNFLQNKIEDLSIREISDLTTGKKLAVIIETKTDKEITKNILEEYLNYELTEENSSIEFTGSSLSSSFYKQLLIAILISFVFMSIVVFILFRTAVPSGAVIISAFADILMTLVIVNILGIKMSGAGIIGLLMLIGYSVDTDILLTNRLLRRHEGTLNERISGAFKTGITMTMTSLVAVTVAFFIVRPFSSILSQIFIILIIGLALDVLNTWITNVSILKWYVERRKWRN
ncbi:MAG: protein translocase subunit SecF [Candidatus Diapherotrites archaeon]